MEERKIDRTDWPSGEWDNEPDRVDFEHAGFACLLLDYAKRQTIRLADQLAEMGHA